MQHLPILDLFMDAPRRISAPDQTRNKNRPVAFIRTRGVAQHASPRQRRTWPSGNHCDAVTPPTNQTLDALEVLRIK